MVVAKLLRLAGPHRNRLILGACLRMVDGLLSLGPVFLLYLVLCSLIAGGAAWSPGTVLLLLGALVLARFALIWCALKTSVPAGFSILSLLRGEYADRIRRMPMGWFHNSSVGDISGALLQDLQYIEPFLVEQLAAMASLTSQIVFGLACVLVVDWRLALLLFLGLAPALPFMVWVNRRMSAFIPLRAQALSDVTSRIIEFTEGINVLKAFGLTGRSFARYERSVTRNRDVNLALIRYVGTAAFFYFICLEFGYAALVAFGLPVPAPDAPADPSRFFAFLFTSLIALRVYTLASTLVDLAGFVRQGETALDRLEKAYPDEEPPSRPQTALPEGHEVVFDQVSFAYANGTNVLSDVSFTMRPGSITAIVGASGSGKTTAANLLCRFWDVGQGSIRIGGADLRDMSEETLWRHVSIVFQNVHLFTDTVGANIRLGRPEAGEEDVRRAAMAARCHEFIMDLPKGYDTLLEEGGIGLSGGQRQRLSIARAILKNAPIIIMDEATASVDLENEFYIQNAISALIQDKTVLIIAHRLSTVTAADQILVMQDGRIAERGTHEELLLNKALYAQLWTAQYHAEPPQASDRT